MALLDKEQKKTASASTAIKKYDLGTLCLTVKGPVTNSERLDAEVLKRRTCMI